MSMKEKMKTVQAAIAAIEKQFGKNALMALGDHSGEQVPCVGTGSPSLDRALGCGGYPRGRVVEIYGPESSGKTTLTLHALAQCQKAGGVAAFIDAEHALDIQYARQLGVNVEQLLISQPDSGEQALDIAESLARSGAIDAIVIDSVAALVPRAEIEGDMGDQHMGLQARLMSQALRKLTPAAFRSGTTIFFINQLRMKLGVTFGSPETTTGGHALKYYASVRLDIRRIGAVKNNDVVVGNQTRVKVVKNKLAPPFRQAEFEIRFGTGIDAVGDLLDVATSQGVVTKRGSYYSYGELTLGQGRERARELLLADLALRCQVEKALAERPQQADANLGQAESAREEAAA